VQAGKIPVLKAHHRATIQIMATLRTELEFLRGRKILRLRADLSLFPAAQSSDIARAT
jgi:hypothetical protein